MSAAGIAPLAPRELREAERLLARAFRENLLNRAVVGGSERRRLRANEAGMRAFLPPALRVGSVLAAHVAERLAGVLVALPPGVLQPPRPGWCAMARLLLVQGTGLAGRWSAVSQALQLHRPLAPHFYLATVGVEPALQRRGIGRALLGHWLASIDAAGARAYLETDSAAGAAWYESFGFAVRAELTLLGVRIFLMERSESASDDRPQT